MTCQFLTVTLQKGELYKLKLKGTPQLQARVNRPTQLKRVPDPAKIRAKLLVIPAKHQMVLDAGKAKTLSGIIFRDFQGAQSVIFAFFTSHWDRPKEKPVATDYCYIPEGESQFTIRFKLTVPVRFVRVHFFDLHPGFVEPKSEVF
jgi:hypothetical protein